MQNIPDDWHCYYVDCEWCGRNYHASEGSCGCESEAVAGSDRPWLENSGYTLSYGYWERKVRTRIHTCRKDHKDGKVKAGQLYRSTTYRKICDDTGQSTLWVKTAVINNGAKNE